MIGDPSNALAHLEYAKVLEDMEDFKGSLKAYAKFVLGKLIFFFALQLGLWSVGFGYIFNAFFHLIFLRFP